MIRLRDMRIIADQLENLSMGGLLVGPCDPVLTGEPILVLMEFPETGDYLDATGVIARIVHGRRPGEGSRCLGLELERDRRVDLILERNLLRRPPVPPRVRPGRRITSAAALARLTAVLPRNAEI